MLCSTMERAFSPSPASKMCMDTLASTGDKFLRGYGLDWGTGIGVLAILAGWLPKVQHVYALDISEENILCAQRNVELNNLTQKVTCFVADSFEPVAERDK